MSLDPVLNRHYINVPKPQSRPIPSSLTSTPPRSQTNSYTRSDLLSLSLSSSPLTALHQPPLPATASKIDDLTRILATPSVEKIEKVNRVLRKDSVEFLEGLVKQGKLDSSTPTTALPIENKDQDAGMGPGVMRSRTLPIPVPAPVVVKRKNTLFPLSNHAINPQDNNGGWGDMVFENDKHNDPTKGEGKYQEELLDFEIDSTLSPIEIELMSAKRTISSPISIPLPTRPQGGGHGSASAIFNKSLGSATLGQLHGQAQYSPSSPSPLSLTIAQSLSKRHDGLRHLVSSSSSPVGISKEALSSPGPITAKSPNVQNVTIISSPIEDLPWRKASLLSSRSIPKASTPIKAPTPSLAQTSTPGARSLNAFAPPFPLPQTSPIRVARAESTTLPLPPSLPKKPTTILPPVFVKRESAMLPQTMALPDIPPMGDDWVGERSLSGNEKRRRASEFLGPSGGSSGASLGSGVEGLSRPGSSLSMTKTVGGGSVGSGIGGSAPSSRRPQRLVSLGEKLKENINRAV